MRAAVLVTAALFFGAAGGLRAQGMGIASESIGAGVVTSYFWHGQHLGGTSLQPGARMELSGGDDAWGVGLLGSTPLAGRVHGQSDPETDAFVYGHIPVGLDLALVPGVTVYAYPGASALPGPSLASASPALLAILPAGKLPVPVPVAQGPYRRLRTEANLGLEVRAGPVTLTPTLAYDLVLRGPCLSCAADVALPLKALGTEIDGHAALGAFGYGHVDAPYAWAASAGGAPVGPAFAVASRLAGSYAEAGVSVPVKVSGHATVTLGWSLSVGMGQRLIPGTGLSTPVAPAARNPLEAGGSALTLACSWGF